jgi:hypothetical protein
MKVLSLAVVAVTIVALASGVNAFAPPEQVHAGEYEHGSTDHGCDEDCDGIPDTPVRFSLGLALPNPSHGMFNIAYEVPWPGSHVTIRVFDITGRLAATLVNEQRTAGRYSARWDGRNSAGERIAPGTYFVRMEGKDFRESSKLTLLR